MTKQGIALESAIEEAMRLGWELPEIVVPEISRGRPKKAKKVLVNSTGNQLIADLVASALKSEAVDATLLKTDFEKAIKGAIPVSVKSTDIGEKYLVSESGTSYDICTQEVISDTPDMSTLLSKEKTDQ